MKFCNKCGNKLEDSAKFCNKCGNKIVKNEAEDLRKSAVSNEESLDTTNNNNNDDNNSINDKTTANNNISTVSAKDTNNIKENNNTNNQTNVNDNSKDTNNINCNKCGNKIEDSSKFCNKCGNKIIKDEAKDLKKSAVSNEESLDTTNNQTNKSNDNSTNNNDDNIINNNPTNTSNNMGNINSINDNNELDDNEDLDRTMMYDNKDFNLNNNSQANNKDNSINNKKTNRHNHKLNDHNHNSNKKFADDITTKENEDYDDYENEIPQKKGKKKYIIIGIILAIVLAIASFLYFSKDSILYSYYYSKANSATSTFEKLTDYNDALEYKYTDDVVNSIYDVLKNDPSFIDEIPKVSNLNKEDTTKLIYKLCTFYADKNFNSGNYDACLNYLDLAKTYGYNEKDYINYDSLMQKINQSKQNTSTDSSQNVYSFKNNTTVNNMPSNIYDYSGDYLLPYSDSTYLDKSDLLQYNKETLALMRNEIYARHGYVFGTEPYKSYFNSKSWYTPNSSFKGDDKDLNEYELANVRTIKSVEDSK